MADEPLCRNCHLQHSRSAAPNCFFVTLRRSGRDPVQLESTTSPALRTRKIPKSFSERTRLQKKLWAEYVAIKEDIDFRRQDLTGSNAGISKGELKAREPIPWLSWLSFSAGKGQTRSEINFTRIWNEQVEIPIRVYRGTAAFYVTSPLLDPSAKDFSEDTAADEEDSDTTYEAASIEIENVLVEPPKYDMWRRRPTPNVQRNNGTYAFNYCEGHKRRSWGSLDSGYGS